MKHNLSAQAPCIGADIYQIVGSTHDLLIVLYHHNGISQILQILQYIDQTIGISGSYRR